MVATGDTAPAFTAPLANGDVDDVSLDAATADGPVVLAFFPGAFTRVCSHEMQTFQERLDEFDAEGATVLGVSVDTPFALNAFRDDLGLAFGLVSDSNRDLVHDYDVAMDFTSAGVDDAAMRAVFVVDQDRTVVYDWVSDNPGVEPDYDEILAAVRAR